MDLHEMALFIIMLNVQTKDIVIVRLVNVNASQGMKARDVDDIRVLQTARVEELVNIKRI
jgi:hypothetical protein